MLGLYIWPEYQLGRQEAVLRNAPIKLSVHRRQVDSGVEDNEEGRGGRGSGGH